MRTFVELPPFARFRAACLDDESFRALQQVMVANPTAGDVIQGTLGLRKLRFTDLRRSKGKRGGLRVIYVWWSEGAEFRRFAICDKDELEDFSTDDRLQLKELVKAELRARRRR